MLIAGAGGHAMEVLHIFDQQNELEGISFFDSAITKEKVLFDRFKVIGSMLAVRKLFEKDRRFVLGLGNPANRNKLAEMLTAHGGVLTTIASSLASVGNFDVKLGAGLNIMSHVVIYNRVNIGEGALLNTACSIHHDVTVGQYCEICPGARLLGGVSVGDFSFIGSGAIILPGVTIGRNCIVGAGAVVTKNLDDEQKVIGVPAHTLKYND